MAQPDLMAMGEGGQRPRFERTEREVRLDAALEKRKSDWETLIGLVTVRETEKGFLRQFVVESKEQKITLNEDQIPGLQGRVSGNYIVIQKKRDSDEQYEVIDDLGEKGSFEAEVLKLAYRNGTGRNFNPDVEREARAWEMEGEQAIEKEIRAKEMLPPPQSLAAWQQMSESYDIDTQRMDFRNVLTATIDPATAKDYDDALSYRKLDDGLIEVGVHIADVTHFLSVIRGDGEVPNQGYATRRSAWFRQFTGYYAGKDMTCPMLPSILSEQLCSLVEGKDRLSMSTVFLIDPKQANKVVHTWVGRGAMHSNKRFTYDEAELLAEIPESEVPDEKRDQREMLNQLSAIGNVFRKEKKERGARSFTGKGEPEIRYSGNSVERVDVKMPLEMHKVIEDWMVRTNEECAQRIDRHSVVTKGALPSLMRRHDPPSLDEMERAAEQVGASAILAFLREHDHLEPHEPVDHKGKQKPLAITVLDMFEEYANEDVVQKEMVDRLYSKARRLFGREQKKEVRTYVQEKIRELREQHGQSVISAARGLMRKAYMSIEGGMHLGLAAKKYAWFTSPIRRHSDIDATELLVESVRKNKARSLLNEASVEEIELSAHLGNEQEKRIDAGEKQTLRMLGAELLQSKIGEVLTCFVSDVLYEEREFKRQGRRIKRKYIKSLIVGVPASEGSYRFMYRIPYLSLFAGKPPKNDELLRMRGQEFSFRLKGVDVSQGSIDLEYVPDEEGEMPAEQVTSTIVPEKRRQEFISEDEASELIEAFEEHLKQMEGYYKKKLDVRRELRKELGRIKASVKKFCGTTWRSTVEKRLGEVRRLQDRLDTAPEPNPVAPRRTRKEQISPDVEVERILAMPPEEITPEFLQSLRPAVLRRLIQLYGDGADKTES